MNQTSVSQSAGTAGSARRVVSGAEPPAGDNGGVTTTSSPVLIILTDRDRAELESLARARKAPLRSVQRAWIVLAAAEGQNNSQIARDLGIHVDTVRTWRGRFAADGLKVSTALQDWTVSALEK